MTTQLLASELANLIQESKRKHNDLRQAAEKSLDELRALKATSEADSAAELAQHAHFVNPFIIACGTKNAKFTGIAIICLQRLIASRALPRAKLAQVLEALREASAAGGLDVQLKTLQALPALLQNYAADVRADLLVTALNVCFLLQASKNAIVNNTSAATLQQLVVSVFDKVVVEDRAEDVLIAGEAPVRDGVVKLKPAALDAYRVFNDLCLMTENQRPEYLRISSLPQTFGLELIESVLTQHVALFSTHPEQAEILRSRVMPFIIGAVKQNPNFATTVRLMRILYTLLRRHIGLLPSESGDALNILIQLLDHDTAFWKRALCMEVFRGIFADAALIRRIFVLFDASKQSSNTKHIIRTLTATLVKLSTEKPSVIGLGPQSTIPVASSSGGLGASTDQAMLDTTTGIISGGSMASEFGDSTGVSTQFSSMRIPCIDQLDKTESPPIPESYIYSLALTCISSLSEGLAKFILPLTVPTDGRRRKAARADSGRDVNIPSSAPAADSAAGSVGVSRDRAASFKKIPVPVNPLTLQDHPLRNEIQTCASIVDECWPAILATCSTFLYAALDSEYYHGLVRAFQKFAHVAGLLQLSTPRDAFLTTLGKAAVPPNVFTACYSMGGPQKTNASSLLTVDSLPERPRQASVDTSVTTLNTRNLLCLRALLNLGIALGPTLGESWSIIIETLQQADLVLFCSHKAAGKVLTATRGQDAAAENESTTLLNSFNSEIRSVETAASRLIESTIDFPNSSFVEVVHAICNLIDRKDETKSEAGTTAGPETTSPTTEKPRTPSQGRHRRNNSLPTSSNAGTSQEDRFVLKKLSDLATINIERLIHYPPEVSGWTPLTSELIRVLNSTVMSPTARSRAAEALVKLILEAASLAVSIDPARRSSTQLRLLEAFRDSLLPLQQKDRQISIASHATDIEIHRIVLEGLKNMLDNCGDSLVGGWDLAFEMIGSIFIDRRHAVDERRGSSVNPIVLMTRSPKLVRAAFSSLQLICSDFLAALPNSCFLILVDTLYKFCSQDDDLNIALTTVTFFWVLSDFLSGKNKSLAMTEELVVEQDNLAQLASMAADPDHKASDAALWMLLLMRLTTVTSDDRLELRNSAIQTLLRIFDAYGEKLTPEAWSMCIKSVIFKLFASIEEEIQAASDDEVDDRDRSEWNDTAVVVLNGVSDLLSSYLEVISAHSSSDQLWREFLSHLARLLDFKVLSINTATFKALGQILSHANNGEEKCFSKATVKIVWELWARGVPTTKEDEGGAKSTTHDNQECLTAYVAALRDIYRLAQEDLDVERVRRMLMLLRDAIQAATVGAYISDIEFALPLQTQILEAIKMVRTTRADVVGLSSVVAAQVAEFVSLAYSDEQLALAQTTAAPRRTYVAMSKTGMAILESTILKHRTDVDIYESGAFAAALAALTRPIALKYSFPVTTKSEQPWRQAVTSILSILEATLPRLGMLEISLPTSQKIWVLVVATAAGIIRADTTVAKAATNIAEDEAFDIKSFQRLRNLIIPALGGASVPDETRKLFAESLFRTSIIHALHETESTQLLSPPHIDTALSLASMSQPRSGSTLEPVPTRRIAMSYVCLEELFALVASATQPASLVAPGTAPSSLSNSLTAQPSIQVQPPTPLNTLPPAAAFAAKSDEKPAQLRARIAAAMAPFLLLRAALALRAYAADHPLRGHMPQPLSQRRELARLLSRLVELRCDRGAVAPAGAKGAKPAAAGERAHLVWLFPLLVAAARVAAQTGDEAVAGKVREALDVVGGEMGVGVGYRG